MATDRLDDGAGPSRHVVRTDALSLAFVPEVGGRLLSLEVDGRELLWRNSALVDRDLQWVRPRSEWPDGASMATWPNLGGAKTWPAPQGWDDPDREWAGPPDPVLDDGEYTWDRTETDESIRVELRSPFDPRSGLRITRRFDIPRTGRTFSQTITFVNESDRERTWAMWEVVQVDTSAAGRGIPAEIAVPARDDRVVDLGTYRGAGTTVCHGRSLVLPVREGVLKRGFPSAEGSIAYREDGRALLELAFAPDETGTYPDGGSRVEIWMQSPQAAPIRELEGLRPDAWLVELEVLSPLRSLAPGDSAAMTLHWRV